MRVVFTGGGSGGHFYPIIAVAEALNRLVEERHLLRPELYYIGPEPYDPRALYENGIIFKASPAGKMRRYFSLLNVIDAFKTVAGILKGIWQLYALYPDVVFGKGGYASFPTLFAARVLRIPVIIHESDAAPGRVTLWASKFARRIAISYPETASAFPGKNIAHTGNPVRKELYAVAHEGGAQFLKLDKNIPTVLILGGSQGAARINDAVLDALPRLVERYQVIHQTGKGNFEEVERTAALILREHPLKERYKPFPFLSALSLRMAAGAASIVISRAGSGSIFEIAAWKVPAILIPIPESVSHDQRKNAYAYARLGGALVIEEQNLTQSVLLSEIERLLSEKDAAETMKTAAERFAMPESARTIAEGILDIALEHERS